MLNDMYLMNSNQLQLFDLRILKHFD